MPYDPDMQALLKAVRASARSPAESIRRLRLKVVSGQFAAGPEANPGNPTHAPEADVKDTL